MKHRYPILALVVLTLCSATFAQVSGTQGLEITVYNQNFGLVKDLRAITFAEGTQTIALTDVAAQIDPTSVHFKSLTAPAGIKILEQNYQFDLVSQEKLLQKYLGKEIEILRYNQDGVLVEQQRGTLLSAQGGSPAVVKVGDQILLNPAGTVRLPALPEGLIIKPTLVWDIWAKAAGEQRCELSYMTQGINWSADYVVVINADDTRADLDGWVTLTNTSGARYPNAKLKLVAGEVHRVQPERRALYLGEAVTRAEEGPPPGFEEKPFFEYHLYTLQRPTTIADNETKQLTLITAPNIGIKKRFIFDPVKQRWWYYNPSQGSTGEQKVQVKIEIENSEEQGLGIPLPKGKVRVYKADQEGALQFVGEDQIDHTPRDEKIRLYLGDAFDLVGERKHTDHREIANNVYKDSFEISLRNHKEAETVEVTVVEHFFGTWEIDRSSHDYKKTDAFTAEFTVHLEPNAEDKVTYTVTTRL